MNRIEELHAKVRNDLREKRPGEYITDAEVGAAFGSVTVDIACKFAEWVEASGYKKVYDGHWQTLLLGSPIYTTAQLFNSEEFQKTI